MKTKRKYKTTVYHIPTKISDKNLTDVIKWLGKRRVIRILNQILKEQSKGWTNEQKKTKTGRD